MRDSIIFLMFVFLCAAAFGQTTTISGTAEKKSDELVRLIVYADNFTHVEKTLASAYTDENGNFELKAEIEESSYALLSLGLRKGEFYIKPGSSYKVNIPFEDERERTSVFDEAPLYFTLEANDGGLNEMIGNFNNDYNAFLLKNSNKLYRSKDKSLVTSFEDSLRQKYHGQTDDFFRDYLTYTFASLEWISKKKTDKQIIGEYFAGVEIPYANIQFAEFFSEFFKSYYGSTSLFSYSELVAAINSGRGFAAVDRLIAREETLEGDPLLRELIGVLLIAGKYYSPSVIKNNAMSLLSEIHRNSKSAMTGQVAANMFEKLKYLSYGTQPPHFSLADAEGEMLGLPQFRNSFLLLYFTRSDCKLCTYYLQNLNQLIKEFNGQVKVLTISDQQGFDEMVKYMSTRSYEWPVVNLGKDFLLAEQYQIRTYPSIVLINPNGTVATANAPLPDEGLSLFIKKYMARYKKDYPSYGKE